MALTDTGTRVRTASGENARTVDNTGSTVVVEASDEAIQDCGWDAIIDVASQKHDAGDTVPGSEPPMVRVTKSDF